jgi:hypothetical protein
MDIGTAVPELLTSHPYVRNVRLIGSRAKGGLHELSDWDFAVETADFDAVAESLPQLLQPLQPLAELWDPYASHACYMLILPGPTKVDVIFPDQPRSWSSAWEVSPETLEAIDRHFWDWILWLEQKRRGGHAQIVGKSLDDMYELMLRPLGVERRPASIRAAMAAYVDARSAREREFALTVSRRLEQEVRPAVVRSTSS